MPSIRRGVSILEVTVVIMIIGLLAAIGAPRFSRATRMQKVRHAAIETAGLVDYLRNVAINEGRTVQFSIDPDTDTFFSPDVDFPDRAGQRITLAMQDRFDPSIELSASFDGSMTMSFDLEGNPVVSGTHLSSGVITIQSYGDGYEIQITPGQGTAAITPVTRDVDSAPAPDLMQIPTSELDLQKIVLDEGGI